MKSRSLLLINIVIVATLFLSCASDTTQGQSQEDVGQKSGRVMLPEEQLNGTITAPDFPAGAEWLNTGAPLSLTQLKGKIVLLDFWTFCCINCMHVLPDLAKLEEKYKDNLVVIGVHSAKFSNEKSTDAIREAILRYDIHHPVINDKDFKVWNDYGIRAWPSFVLINPDGKIIGTHSGEDMYDLFDQVIEQAIDYFGNEGKLNDRNFQFVPEMRQSVQHILKYPGKVGKTEDGKLIITDSNNNRILIVQTGGQIESVIGSGREGQADGSFAEAQFNKPQGVVQQGSKLYIADTENHLIRVADLEAKTVETVLGTGKQARRYNIPGQGTEVALNSPWDLTIYDGELYIAMAGSHQIWVADVDSWNAKPFAGSASENILDEKLLSANLAQPSGITTDGKKLYFADSETSSIRSADLDPTGNVKTIIGEGLFEYGDKDDRYPLARLQHPLGLVYRDSLLYVADTYNHKIKIVDPLRLTSTTLAGTGDRGLKDGSFKEAQFDEPSGLVFLGDKLYVADANNHQIRILDLKTESVSTLVLKSIGMLAEQTMENFDGRVIEMPKRTLHTGKAAISFALNIPEGYELNKEAPFYLDFRTEDTDVVQFVLSPDQVHLDKEKLLFEIPVEMQKGDAKITVDAVIYMCDKKSGLCIFDNLRVLVSIEGSDSGAGMFGVALNLRTTPRI